VAGLQPRKTLKQGSVWDAKPLRYKPAEFRSRSADPRESSPAPGNDQRTINRKRWHYNDKKYGIQMWHLHRTNFQNDQPRRSKGDFSMLRRWTKWLRYTQHLGGRARNVHKHARQACSRILRARVRDRTLKKRNMRWIWIKRITNNCNLHGVRYPEFLSELKAKKISLNRKMLQQLAIYDRALFTNIMDITIPDWPERKEFWSKVDVSERGPPKLPPADVEEDHKKNEKLVIDYIEQMLPRMYTDDTIRFNRKAYSWGTQFTVDCGDKEYWQEVLPRYPELANFQVADYWTQRPNEQKPILKADLLPTIAKFDAPQWPQDPRETPVKGSLPIQEDEEVKDEKPGISRESWFDDEPQSWFD
jgi:large subunit ribosomal protein L20